MSAGAPRKSVRGALRAAACLALAVIAVALVLAGCSSPDDLRSLTTSVGVNLPAGTPEPAYPPQEGWPPGIAMILVSNGYTIYAIDRDGVRWSQEVQTKKESNNSVPFSGVATSTDGRFIAYVEHRKEIVLRSFRDGSVINRIPYKPDGETYLSSISLDGGLAALTSIPPGAASGAAGDGPPWQLTIVDLRTGQATVKHPVQDLSAQHPAGADAQFAVIPLEWLPGGRLLINGGPTHETFSYDPATGDMQPIPGMQFVRAVSPAGTVYGFRPATPSASSQTQIWKSGTAQLLKSDPLTGSPSGGAFNATGDALVVLMSGIHADGLGWQLYRLVDGRWQTSGALAENTWMRTEPAALSADGTVAWATLQRANGELVVLSHDFRTGEWKEWLAKDSLPVHLDWYHIDAIIPE